MARAARPASARSPKRRDLQGYMCAQPGRPIGLGAGVETAAGTGEPVSVGARTILRRRFAASGSSANARISRSMRRLARVTFEDALSVEPSRSFPIAIQLPRPFVPRSSRRPGAATSASPIAEQLSDLCLHFGAGRASFGRAPGELQGGVLCQRDPGDERQRHRRHRDKAVSGA